MIAASDTNAAQKLLTRRAADYRRSGKRLSPVELLRLYRNRHQVNPNRHEAALLLASLRWEQRPGLRLRQREVGWFWFRRWPRSELRALLDKVGTGSCERSQRMSAKKSIPSRFPEDRAGLRRFLESAAMNEQGRLRADAIRSLAAFSNREDLPLLRKLARDAQFSVRWAVAESLGRFQCPADVPLLKRLARAMHAGPALEALVRYRGSVAAAAIHRLARDKDSCLRSNLAGWLDEWKHRDAATILRRLARDKDEGARSGAASSLGALRRAKDLPLLRRMTHDENSSVRREAVWAVGLYHQAKDIALLQARTRDEAWEVRAVAAMALTRIMGRRALERWLDENTDHLSFEVVRELDFALYAPGWLKKMEPRAADNEIRLELGICRPDWAEMPGRAVPRRR